MGIKYIGSSARGSVVNDTVIPSMISPEMDHIRIYYKRWLWIIKCFELELSARKIASQVQLSYPTVLKTGTLIRLAIISHGSDVPDLLKGEFEPDETYFGGRRKGKRKKEEEEPTTKSRYSGSLKNGTVMLRQKSSRMSQQKPCLT